MLIRKENEIEIWTDTIEKGKGKKAVILGIVTIIFWVIVVASFPAGFSIKESYYILGLFSFPSFIIIISGLIIIKREKEGSNIIAKVNNDYVILYEQKNEKQINIKQITKINKISSSLGSFLTLFYNENGQEKKYLFNISPANKNILVIAIKEFNKNVEVEVEEK